MASLCEIDLSPGNATAPAIELAGQINSSMGTYSV
jgi:hypothetical protein